MKELTEEKIPQLIQVDVKPTSQNGNASKDMVDNDIEDLNKQSQRIQELIDELDLIPDSKTKEFAQECIQEIVGFYGKGLERMLHIISANENSSAKNTINKLIEDNFISGLLLIHDLHPLSLETRLKNALEKVRPYMDSHGGSVEIVSLDEGVAKLRLSGSCKGCPSSSITLELGIKEAIEENCPDLLGLEVDGAVSLNKDLNQNGKESSQPTTKGWKVINDVTQFRNGTMTVLEISGVSLVICRLKDQFYAYKNLCPGCDLPLNDGKMKGRKSAAD
ncbi:MAG: NifU family protein [Bacteroidota bacterium]|nr:NifU family protein [Bacteroidota bacterium]